MFPVRPLLRAGSAEQKARWLPRLAAEDGCLAAIALTEPGARSDVAVIDAKVLQIVEGTSEIQRHIVTQYLRR